MSARHIVITGVQIVRALPTLAYAAGLHAWSLAKAVVWAVEDAFEDD